MNDIIKEIKKSIKHSGKWVVVLDDSNCTVGVGGEGYLWYAVQSTYNADWYNLKRNKKDSEIAVYSYGKEIFRDATKEEIKNWLENKIRADVPLNNKPKLYIYG